MIKKLIKYITNKAEIMQLKRRTDCKVGSFVEVKNSNCFEFGKNVRIGERSKILCWNEYTSGKEKQELSPRLIIGDNFSATEALLVQCAGTIKIGDNVLIARNVSILDYNHGFNPCVLNYLDNNLEPRNVVIEEGAWIGNNVIILPGAHIGKKCIIGAGSVVTSHIKDYSIAVGNPARIIKKYNFELKTWQKI